MTLLRRRADKPMKHRPLSLTWLSALTVVLAPAVHAEDAKRPVLTIGSHKNLYLECTSEGTRVDFFINGTRSGMVQGGTFGSGLGSYGAVPGLNTLTLKVADDTEPGALECHLFERRNDDDSTKKALPFAFPKPFTVKAGELIDLSFILSCPGYWPKLAREWEEAVRRVEQKHAQLAPKPRATLVRQDLDALREQLVSAKTQAQAKSVLLNAGK